MAGAQPTRRVEHYNYVDLAHICQSGLAHGSSNYRRPQFNCYAVVAECSQPRPTRGTGA